MGTARPPTPTPTTPRMGKRSAQAKNAGMAGGVRDQSRMAMTRHEAWGNAREPDGGTPGRSSVATFL
ncbi:MAG: hypothetical protein WC073_10215 [Sterolibacterium sp.]